MIARLLALDEALAAWIAAHHTPLLDAVMTMASAAGRAGTIWLVIGVFLVLRHPRLLPGLWQVFLAIVLAYLVTNVVLKPIVGRERPAPAVPAAVGAWPIELPAPSSPSFPSGHTAEAFGAVWVLAGLVRARAAAALWVLAGLVGLSRVYLGVHYPLDVLAGAIVGLGAGVLTTGRAGWRTVDAGAARIARG